MTVTPPDVDPQVVDSALSGTRRGTFARLLKDPVTVVALAILLIIIVVGLLAPWIEPHNPATGNLELVDAPPGGSYMLGGDGSGRDVLSRLIASIDVSLESAVIATAVAMLIGVTTGLAAGYLGRWLDGVASWIASLVMALPGVILLIALYPVTGGSIEIQMVILGVLMAPGIFRLVRNMVVAVKNELYVDAARVSGLSNARILSRHILYVVRAPLIIQGAFIAGIAISLQAGLALIGIENSTTPSWGLMLNDGFTSLYTAPILVVWPGIMLGLTTTCLVLVGNGLRDTLEGVQTVPARTKLRSRITRSTQHADPNPVLLSVHNLRIAYPTRGGIAEVVSGVSLDVRVGEVLGVVGESGSGKSQTAFAALGLLPKEAIVVDGSVRLNGEELLDMSTARLRKLRGTAVAYVPQEPMSNLDPSFTVGNQVVYGIRAATRISRNQAKERAIELFTRVGIANPRAVFGKYPHEISGGMAQRVLIAGAVACNPKLLIADEPTTALDVTVQAEVLDLLRDLQKEREMGVVLVTHNFGVVADLCDRVAVMEKGVIVEQGTVAQIFAHPKHAYTQMLLGSILDESKVRADLIDSTYTGAGE